MKPTNKGPVPDIHHISGYAPDHEEVFMPALYIVEHWTLADAKTGEHAWLCLGAYPTLSQAREQFDLSNMNLPRLRIREVSAAVERDERIAGSNFGGEEYVHKVFRAATISRGDQR